MAISHGMGMCWPRTFEHWGEIAVGRRPGLPVELELREEADYRGGFAARLGVAAGDADRHDDTNGNDGAGGAAEEQELSSGERHASDDGMCSLVAMDDSRVRRSYER
jgi:hypothetical protein